MRRRMQRDDHLLTEYNSFMAEYEHLGHMHAVASELESGRSPLYYIPHHAIWQTADSGPKLRIVFHASLPSSSGLSLNDILFTGPKLQNDLATVITRWRMWRYVFNCDIEKAYRQILVDPRDHHLQRILWKRQQDDHITHFELQTVTYGTCCAPYLAIRTLHQLATDEERNYPNAARIIRENSYVDDILAGANTVEDARTLRDQVISLLKSGGFPLRKWSSNCPDVISDLPTSDRLRPS